MEQLQTLGVITTFTLLLLALAFIICMLGAQAQHSEQVADVLQYKGVIYKGKRGRGYELFLNTRTDKAYFKCGIQWRCNDTGRIVAAAEAVN